MPQYDMCLRCTSFDVLVAALQSYGFTASDGSLITASHDHALQYVGRVVQAPAETDAEGNVTVDSVFYDGEYAVLRAEETILDQISAATMDGVEIVVPPAGLPTFGDWRERPAVDLDALKAAKSAENTANCEAVLAPLGAEYGDTERATWDQQYAEAQALMASPTASVPLLDAMATARGMDKAALAQRIIRNREAWVLISGSVVGQRQRIEDAIQAAETPEALAAVDMTITLPG